MAKVSVIIPSYNHQNYIEQRLDSILNQTYTDWEAIIIDDASTDNSVSIIERYISQYPNFKVKQFIKNTVNSGSGYKSWQKGIALAETEFVWVAETDDYCSPKFLETTISSLILNDNAALAYTSSRHVDESGKFLYDSSKRLSKLALDTNEAKVFEGEIITQDLPLNPLITNGSSVVFRKPKSKIPEIIFKNKQLSDLFLWTHILENKMFICVNQPLNFFRRHEASTTEINFSTHNSKVYEEYGKYLNYFNLDFSKSIEVLDHYIKYFLIPNRKSVGFFYTKPIDGITSISGLTKGFRIIYGYFKHLFSKM